MGHRISHADYVRRVANKVNPQPLYDALRLHEAADYIESLERTVDAQGDILSVAVDIIERHPQYLRGEEEAMMRLLRGVKDQIDAVRGPNKTIAVGAMLTAEGEIDPQGGQSVFPMISHSGEDIITDEVYTPMPWEVYTPVDDPSLDYGRLNRSAPPFVPDPDTGDAPPAQWFNGNWMERAYRLQEHRGTLNERKDLNAT